MTCAGWRQANQSESETGILVCLNLIPRLFGFLGISLSFEKIDRLFRHVMISLMDRHVVLKIN